MKAIIIIVYYKLSSTFFRHFLFGITNSPAVIFTRDADARTAGRAEIQPRIAATASPHAGDLVPSIQGQQNCLTRWMSSWPCG